MGYEQRCYSAKNKYITLNILEGIARYTIYMKTHYTTLYCYFLLHYNHLVHDSLAHNTRLRHIAARNLRTWHPNCCIRSTMMQDLCTLAHLYLNIISIICVYIYIYILLYIITGWPSGSPSGSPSPPMPFVSSVQPRQLLCFMAICRASSHDAFGTLFSVHLQCLEDSFESWLSLKT